MLGLVLMVLGACAHRSPAPDFVVAPARRLIITPCRELEQRSSVGPFAPPLATLTTPADLVGVTGLVSARDGKPIPGVTVVVTSPSLNITAAEISDDNGQYAVAVPAGSYTVTFYYAASKFERTGIVVPPHGQALTHQKIDLDAAESGETMTITTKVGYLGRPKREAWCAEKDTACGEVALPGRTIDGWLAAQKNPCGVSVLPLPYDNMSRFLIQ